MPFINGGHIWLILGLIVLLVVFGPGKLPELGTAVGKTIKAFKRSTEDLKAEMSHKDSSPRPPRAGAKSLRPNPTVSSTGASAAGVNTPAGPSGHAHRVDRGQPDVRAQPSCRAPAHLDRFHAGVGARHRGRLSRLGQGVAAAHPPGRPGRRVLHDAGRRLLTCSQDLPLPGIRPRVAGDHPAGLVVREPGTSPP